MSKKIAPTLTAWLEECDRHGLQWHKPIAREVRSLLAVARAAERLTKPPAPCPPICPEWDAMFRALDRLGRRSRPQRAGRGRA